MRLRAAAALAALPALLIAALAVHAGASPAQDVSVRDYEPRSTLHVAEHPLTHAKYPFVDVHGHINDLSPTAVDQMVAAMDGLHLETIVNLSGGSGQHLRSWLASTHGRYPERFVAFATPSYQGIDDAGYAESTADQFERDVRDGGAVGLKIFKNLGMFAQDRAGHRIHTDDPRLDPLWHRAGTLHVPVLIHTGEPVAFWSPWDRYNERWLELYEFPDRRRDDPSRFASFEDTMAEQHAMFRKHPETTFIAAHLDWLGNDLGRLGKLLDELPNVSTEIGAVLAELGRQPRFAREWLIHYQDRVMFGKDSWQASEYPTYFRVLETADDYFPYYRRRHAFWKIYGVDLPDDVLRKLYYENALAFVPRLDRTRFPAAR